MPEEEQAAQRAPADRAPDDVIDALPKSVFRGKGAAPTGRSTEVSCSVCMDDYVDGDRLATMPCGHSFHLGCLRPWLERSRRCPMCNEHCCGPAAEAAEA